MKAFLAVFISLLIFGYCSAIISSFTPLYRYVKSSGGSRHYYTTNLNKIGTAIAGHKGKYGYKSEGISCILASQSCKNVYHNNYIIIVKDGSPWYVGITRKKNGGPYILQIFNPFKCLLNPRFKRSWCSRWSYRVILLAKMVSKLL